MIRKVFIFFFLSFITASLLPCQESLFYVDEKRLEPAKTGVSYVVMIISSNHRQDNIEAFKDYQAFPRFKVIVLEDTYNRVVEKAYYTYPELQELGISLPAERSDQETVLSLKAPVIQPKSEQKKDESKLMEIQDELRKATIAVVTADGKVTHKSLKQLKEKVDGLGHEKWVFKNKWGELNIKELSEEKKALAFSDQLEEVLNDYTFGWVDSDKKNEVKDFLQELTGREGIRVAKKIFWWIPLAMLIGIPLLLLMALEVETPTGFTASIIFGIIIAGVMSVVFF